MTEMEQRVAKAIEAAVMKATAGTAARDAARAAIRAMREPTEKMVDFGQARRYRESTIRGIWTAMIDTASPP